MGDKISKKKQIVPALKPKAKDLTAKSKKSEKNPIDSTARKIMPTKPMPAISQSKLKKDENNKKVMETRKAAVLAKSKKKVDDEEKQKPKKIVPKGKIIKSTKQENDQEEGIKVNEKNVAEKVTEAIALGEIDDSRLIKDEDEEKESIVEKDQIEEMETSPIREKVLEQDYDKDVDEDGEELELQRIKDDDDDDIQHPVPDIGNKILDEVKEVLQANIEQQKLPLDKEPIAKVPYSHVKTPDEVDDLPEHEVVAPDENVLKELQSDESEEKIMQDEQEKEDIEKNVDEGDNSEESIEALRSNEIVEVPVEQRQLLSPEKEFSKGKGNIVSSLPAYEDQISDAAVEKEENFKTATEIKTSHDVKPDTLKSKDDTATTVDSQTVEKVSKDQTNAVNDEIREKEDFDHTNKESADKQYAETENYGNRKMDKISSVETEDLESKQTVEISIGEDEDENVKADTNVEKEFFPEEEKYEGADNANTCKTTSDEIETTKPKLVDTDEGKTIDSDDKDIEDKQLPEEDAESSSDESEKNEKDEKCQPHKDEETDNSSSDKLDIIKKEEKCQLAEDTEKYSKSLENTINEKVVEIEVKGDDLVSKEHEKEFQQTDKEDINKETIPESKEMKDMNITEIFTDEKCETETMEKETGSKAKFDPIENVNNKAEIDGTEESTKIEDNDEIL